MTNHRQRSISTDNFHPIRHTVPLFHRFYTYCLLSAYKQNLKYVANFFFLVLTEDIDIKPVDICTMYLSWLINFFTES